MGMDGGTEHRFQHEKKLTSRNCLRNKKNIVTSDACNTFLGIALWQIRGNGGSNSIPFANRCMNNAGRKDSVD